MHLHDCREINGKARSHCVIGSGDIDFGAYLRPLSLVDVMDYCIEVRPREKALESLIALKKLVEDGG